MPVVPVVFLLLPALAHALVLWASGRRLLARDRWRIWVPIAGGVAVATAWGVPVQRRATLLAVGIGAVYLAVALAAFATLGWEGDDTGRGIYRVASVLKPSAADGILEAGDRIVGLDGAPLVDGDGPSLGRRIADGGGRPARLAIERDGIDVAAIVAPRYDQAFGAHQLGVILATDPIRQRPGAADAAARALAFPAVHGRAAITAMKDEASGFAVGLGLASLASVLLVACDLVLMVVIGLIAVRRGVSSAVR